VEGTPAVNSTAYKFISCLNDNFWTQNVKFHTRARGSQTPHILDLIISNKDFVDDIFNLSPLGKGDHSALHCVCKLNYVNTVNVSKYNYSRGNYNGFCEFLRSHFHTKYFSLCESVNDSWSNLRTTLETGQKLFIPLVDICLEEEVLDFPH